MNNIIGKILIFFDEFVKKNSNFKPFVLYHIDFFLTSNKKLYQSNQQ